MSKWSAGCRFWHFVAIFSLLKCRQLILSPHLLVLTTSERFLSAGGTFRANLASESHWLQPVLVHSVYWWLAPAGVGRVLITKLETSFANHWWTCDGCGSCLRLDLRLESLNASAKATKTHHNPFSWNQTLFLTHTSICGMERNAFCALPRGRVVLCWSSNIRANKW
jgi:hypothetical protein